LEATGRLLIPAQTGTPGLPNSILRDNWGPAIEEVTHFPALPPANTPVRVTASIQDLDGVGSATLVYRLDTSTQTNAVVMNDAGTDGDAVAGDGIYSGLIPPQAASVLVAFHVLAADESSVQVQSRFPAAPPRECLVRFGEQTLATSFGCYRLWLTTATVNAWRNRPVLSNEELDGTFVYGNQRVVYNCGGRYSGSPWHQNSYDSPVGRICTYALSMPGDQKVLGTDSFNKVHAPGNTPGDDGTIQCEQTAYWMARQLGLHANYQRYVVMFVNGVRRGSLMEDTQVPANDVLEERYPGDSDGPLHKLSGWYEFEPGTGQVIQHTLMSWCTLNNYTTTGGEKKVASYRWNWFPRSEGNNANDFSRLFPLIDAANTPYDGPFVSNMRAQANMDQWLKTFALQHAVGNWDSFGNRNAQNMYAYKPSKGPW
ncbi:hypothetical protein EG834_13345, partial [bacterium]|nr:hypothetical protein [bacterium]